MRLKHLSRFVFALVLISALSYNIGSLGYSEVPAGETAGAQDARFRREWEADEDRTEDDGASAEIVDTTKSSAPESAAAEIQPVAAEAHSLGSSQYAIESLPASAAAAGLVQPQVTAADEAMIENVSDETPRASVWSRVKTKLGNFKARVATWWQSRFAKRESGDIETAEDSGSAQYAIESIPAAAVAPRAAQPQIAPAAEAAENISGEAPQPSIGSRIQAKLSNAKNRASAWWQSRTAKSESEAVEILPQITSAGEAASGDLSEEVSRPSVWSRVKTKLGNFKTKAAAWWQSRFPKRGSDETKPSDAGSAQFALEQMPSTAGLPQLQSIPPLPAPRLPSPEPAVQPGVATAVGLEPTLRPPVATEPVTPPAGVTPIAATSIPSAVTSLNLLEAEMNQASQNLDFETAILIRDQVRELMKNPDVKLMADLDTEMRQAAANLDFERAIALRDRIREIEGKVQITIRREPGKPLVVEIPKPVIPEVKFTVNQFTITGNENVRTEDLQPVLNGLIGREITFSDIRSAASQMKALYRQKGYIAAYVYIPPQAVKDGTVEVRVIEGRLGKIEVQGNRYFSTGLIQNMVQRFGLEPGQMISTELLKNSLNQVNKHRDIQTKAVLRPGAEQSTTDLLVEVEDRSPFHATVDFNNYGTRLTGKERLGTTLTHTNLTGRLDELTGRFQGSDGSLAIAADYNMPLFDYDQRLGFAFVNGDIDLGGDFKALDVEGHATTYSAYFVQPLWKNAHVFGEETWDTSVRLGLDHKSIENRILDTPAGRDELRVVNTVFNLEETDAYGKTYMPNSFHFGLDALGATEKNNEGVTRAGSGAPFFIYKALLDRFMYLPLGMMLGFHSSLQMTPDELPASEQFQLGGVGSVRGYPQGEYLGDSGVSMQAELLIPSYFIPEDWRFMGSKRPMRDEIKWVGFYDMGTADIRGALPGEAASKDLSGAGFGVRMRLFDKFTSRIEYAYPLADKTSDGNKGAFYYGLSYDVL